MGHDMGHQEKKGRKTNGSQTARKPGSIACSPESHYQHISQLLPKINIKAIHWAHSYCCTHIQHNHKSPDRKEKRKMRCTPDCRQTCLTRGLPKKKSGCCMCPAIRHT
jgi:hypothetical protein